MSKKKKPAKETKVESEVPSWLGKILSDYDLDKDKDITISSADLNWGSTGQYQISNTSLGYALPNIGSLSWDEPKTSVHISEKGLDLPEDADISIGGVSLKKTLEDLARRVEILVPDPALEREYEELRQARENYDRVREKLEMLEVLRKSPPKSLDSQH